MKTLYFTNIESVHGFSFPVLSKRKDFKTYIAVAKWSHPWPSNKKSTVVNCFKYNLRWIPSESVKELPRHYLTKEKLTINEF